MTIAAILCWCETYQKLQQHEFEFNTMCIFQILKIFNARSVEFPRERSLESPSE